MPAPASSFELRLEHLAEIREPAQLRALSLVDGRGESVDVSCISCHSLAPLAALRAEGVAVHGDRELLHGDLSCRSCHAPERHDGLVLAGGETIDMTEAIVLCAQCHGPQFRDYRHGSHGGMLGHWDRAAGTRVRKHCVECHEPHAPAFRSMMPVLPPSTTAPRRP